MNTSKSLPSGRVTIVFTDIEDSSLMTADLGNTAYFEMLHHPHQALLLAAFGQYNGIAVHSAGDSYMAVFENVDDALACVVAIQNQLAISPISASSENRQWRVSIRIGVHTAEQDITPNKLTWVPNAEYVPGDVEYSGTDTNFAARIGALGVGGQIIVSNSAYLSSHTADRYNWHSWDNRRVKSFERAPEAVWELLYDDISRGEPGARWVPDWYRGELNRYIPRPELEREVIDLFKTGKGKERRRLVTLCGDGGMGKSRLAVACALAMVGLFQDGVYFVDLSRDVHDEAQCTRESLAQTIAQALGFPEEQQQPDSLIAALKLSERLIVLDNYESMDSRSVRLFIRDLIVQARSLCLLVTGRTSVNIPDVELIVSLNDGMTVDQARDLFLACTGSSEYSETSSLSVSELMDLERLLKLTEYIPLAVELAAAWTASRSIKEIADGLEETPLGRMSQAPGDAERADSSPHHDSLNRSLDWSYGLLDSDHQEAFSVLGLFDDTFSHDALAYILDKDINRIEDMLDHLRRYSLARRIDSGSATRYTLHRFTREYAKGKLEGLANHERLQQRYVGYYRSLVATKWNIADPKVWKLWTDEWRNMLTAVRLAEKIEDWTAVFDFGPIVEYFNVRGMSFNQRTLTQLCLDAARKAGNRSIEALAFTKSTSASDIKDRIEGVKAKIAESIVGFRYMKGKVKAPDLQSLGFSANTANELASSERKLLGSIEAYVKSESVTKYKNLLADLGRVSLLRKDESAENVIKESLAISTDIGEGTADSWAHLTMGRLYLDQGHSDNASNEFKSALEMFGLSSDRVGEAWSLFFLAQVYIKQEGWNDAEIACRNALINFGDSRLLLGEGKSLTVLAGIMRSQGKSVEAMDYANESVNVLRMANDIQALGEADALLSDLTKVH